MIWYSGFLLETRENSQVCLSCILYFMENRLYKLTAIRWIKKQICLIKAANAVDILSL